ncbi:MAG: GntR family transcriptional regulator [Lentisphaeria bacterium]|nr:GntR family transcriptional regulator [Lentisphaeria bacterium]
MNKSEEIFESLAGRITSGELTGRLPAEQKLAREYGVSPVTAAKALNLLRDKGLVRRVHGSGTYVNAPGSLAWINWPLFTVGLVVRGFSDEDIAKILGQNFLRVLAANRQDD